MVYHTFRVSQSAAHTRAASSFSRQKEPAMSQTTQAVWPNHFVGVDVISTVNRYRFGFMRPPLLHPVPIPTMAGPTLHVSDQITVICGFRTGVGYYSVEMPPSVSLEYRGTYRAAPRGGEQPQLLCFSLCRRGTRVRQTWADRRVGMRTYATVFEGFQWLDTNRWEFQTPQHRVRWIQTTKLKRRHHSLVTVLDHTSQDQDVIQYLDY